MGEKTITISVEEYEDLKSDKRTLDKLYAAGVDSWDGYDFAMDIDTEND